MTLIINGVDFSAYIQQKTDITESVRKIYGANEGQSIRGDRIVDLVNVKIDPAFKLKPLPQTLLNQFYNVMHESVVTVQYTSFTDGEALRTIRAIPLEFAPVYAMTLNGVRIYDGVNVAFSEQ